MKYILLALITISLFSCEDSNRVVISQEEYDRLKGIPQSEYPKPFHFMKGSNAEDNRPDWQIILGEDDHEYIENNGYDSYIMFHSPECKLCRNRQYIQPTQPQDTTSCPTKH
jgi:hypothetical protein